MTDARLDPPPTDPEHPGRARCISLDDSGADDVTRTGAKAAALARARQAGLATLQGVILTTAFSRDVDGGADPATHAALREAFERAGGETRSLVVRSSSIVEDLAGSSMAGQFESVIGVDGLDDFVASVRAVLDSRARAGAATSPIAVLVQPLVEPVGGGVLFGVDPVSGRSAAAS